MAATLPLQETAGLLLQACSPLKTVTPSGTHPSSFNSSSSSPQSSRPFTLGQRRPLAAAATPGEEGAQQRTAVPSQHSRPCQAAATLGRLGSSYNRQALC